MEPDISFAFLCNSLPSPDKDYCPYLIKNIKRGLTFISLTRRTFAVVRKDSVSEDMKYCEDKQKREDGDLGTYHCISLSLNPQTSQLS